MPTPTSFHLAVALNGAGWHPAAWREPAAQPERLFTAGYWTELARQAEGGLGTAPHGDSASRAG